jgi:hypothetical protein
LDPFAFEPAPEDWLRLFEREDFDPPLLDRELDFLLVAIPLPSCS